MVPGEGCAGQVGLCREHSWGQGDPGGASVTDPGMCGPQVLPTALTPCANLDLALVLWEVSSENVDLEMGEWIKHSEKLFILLLGKETLLF